MLATPARAVLNAEEITNTAMIAFSAILNAPTPDLMTPLVFGDYSRARIIPGSKPRFQPFAIARARIGLSTNKASATTMKFISAVTTNTVYQEPVDALIRLATGTRKADVPLAV